MCGCVSVPGPLVYFLQQVDRALSRASPFAAAGVVVGTVYWSAVTYGAVTVMQVRWRQEEERSLALLGSFEHFFFSVFRWWGIRRVWMWWSARILSSCSWVYPPSPSCWYWGKWSAGRITWCGSGSDTLPSFRSSAGLYLVCGRQR